MAFNASIRILINVDECPQTPVDELPQSVLAVRDAARGRGLANPGGAAR